ncbi:MAG: DEAD/DEAH box helicase [Flavobacteriales bacterium]|jgi:superfamily II DNA or RNA helicase|nr:DEAD/DEAH box helicase [Flavobacteriales bacterium]
MSSTTYNPGKLVKFRDRDWIVLPSGDADLVMLRPLGGAEEETTAVYVPMRLPGEEITDSEFPKPSAKDLGDFTTARLLFNAARLSFRHASGPFRCMGRLSFRPRNYQLVPLVMALKQDTVRLMVADDVGIGKTIEALLILREMMERGEIKRFAVLCPPHLCDQWQQELRDKLDIEAVVIRSGTVLSLERKVPAGQRLFHFYPYQVISIDYIKSDRNRKLFLDQRPEFIIVDEAHTCALPQGSKSPSQQMRFSLLNELAKKPDQHLLLLTATPHSGKDEEFSSLLGLLKKDLKDIDLQNAEKRQREHIAQHFIQRKREHILHWAGEDTPFPKRVADEITYELSADYATFYGNVVRYARGISQKKGPENKERMRYWAALSLLRGCVSSPANAFSLLSNRYQRKLEDGEAVVPEEGTSLLRQLETDSDATETDIIALADLDEAELKALAVLGKEVQALHGEVNDLKLRAAVKAVTKLLKEGYQPIIFCRYIATAEYVANALRAVLPKKVDVRAVTSTVPDEDRKKAVLQMGAADQRVLVATDCLSEGINLQEQFTAVLHYDLPWNPNRLEQREGRVDRFGQRSKTVKTVLLRGSDNPVDQFVLAVLIDKVKQIQGDIGVSISIGENNAAVMDAAVRKLILDPDAIRVKQLRIDFGTSAPELQAAEHAMTQELEEMKKRAARLRDIFAHNSVDQKLIEAELKEVDEAIGDVKSVEAFALQAIAHLGGSATAETDGYLVQLRNLPPHLKNELGVKKDEVRLSFLSPTPEGYQYLGRNHRFVEQLCQYMLSLSFEARDSHARVARTAVVVTDAVSTRTTLVQFRVRNVIKEVNSQHQVISEEMYLWGYAGSGADSRTLPYAEAKQLLLGAKAAANLSAEQQLDRWTREEKAFTEREPEFHALAVERAKHLVEAHGRFKTLVGGRRFEAMHPVLPPDVMGVYILVPRPNTARA